MSDKKYTPGYVEVPGKGTKYRNERGEFFDTHWGSIGNSFGNIFRGAEQGYNNYYNSVADATGGERRDGSIKPKAPKTALTGKSVVRAFGKEFDKSDPKQLAEYNKLQNAELERQRNRSKFADPRGGDGLKTDGKTRFEAPAENSDAPPRPSPLVSEANQQGRTPGKLSSAGFKEANDLLAQLGITTVGYSGFESTHLPKPNGEQITGADGKSGTENIGKNGTNMPEHAGKYLSPQPIAAQQVAGTDKIPQNGAVKATDSVRPESAYQQMGTNARYSAEFMKDRPDMPAQYNTSLVGLRAAEASKGLLYASGKYWKANPNAGGEGEKDFIEIDKAEWNTIKRNDPTPQEFKDQKVGEVKQGLSQKGGEVEDGVGYTTVGNKFKVTEDQTPVTKTPPNPAEGLQIPTQPMDGTRLTDKVDVRYQDTDKSGRYNKFR